MFPMLPVALVVDISTDDSGSEEDTETDYEEPEAKRRKLEEVSSPLSPPPEECETEVIVREVGDNDGLDSANAESQTDISADVVEPQLLEPNGELVFEPNEDPDLERVNNEGPRPWLETPGLEPGSSYSPATPTYELEPLSPPNDEDDIHSHTESEDEEDEEEGDSDSYSSGSNSGQNGTTSGATGNNDNVTAQLNDSRPRTPPMNFIISDDNLSDISDMTISPPLTPPTSSMRRRNAIFARRNPPTPDPNRNQDDDYFHDQLEVASVSDINDNPVEDPNSTSGGEEVDLNSTVQSVQIDINLTAERPLADTDNGESNFADEDGDSDSADAKSKDNEQGGILTEAKAKTWACTVCSSQILPNFRHCVRCFKLRRNWLPERPRSKRLKRMKRQLAAERSGTSGSTLSTSRTTMSASGSDSNSPMGVPRDPRLNVAFDEGTDSSDLDEPVPVSNPVAEISSDDVASDAEQHDTTAPATLSPVPVEAGVETQPFYNPPSPSARTPTSSSPEPEVYPSRDPSPPPVTDNQPSQNERAASDVVSLSPILSSDHDDSVTEPSDTELYQWPDPEVRTSQPNSNQASDIETNSLTEELFGPTNSSTPVYDAEPAPESLACEEVSPQPRSQSMMEENPEQEKCKDGTASGGGGDEDGTFMALLCSICFLRNRNTAFVHNKTAHVASCFTCADKILKKTGKCPICRKRAFRVVRLIIA